MSDRPRGSNADEISIDDRVIAEICITFLPCRARIEEIPSWLGGMASLTAVAWLSWEFNPCRRANQTFQCPGRDRFWPSKL
jgi:hypothetical protein